MQKLIIGCGYLGHRVAQRWQQEGHSVAVLTRWAERAAAFRAQGLQAHVGDVMCPQSLSSLPAAQTVLYAVGYDRASPHSQREVYVEGIENVLRQLPGRAERVIYISSTSVYGQRDGEWVDESSACAPRTPNGKACLEAESALRRFATAAPSTRVNVLRLAGIYGPGRLLRRIEELRSGAPISGNPQRWLNLIHADDAARAVLACEARGRGGEIYLVCDDRPVRRREYYARLAAVIGATPPVFETVDSATTADLNKRCSNRRLRQELAAGLQYPTIESGLPHAVAATGSTA